MRPLLSFIALVLLIANTTHAQSGVLPDTVFLHQTREWPSVVNETSGIAHSSGLVWTFNDSGGKPILYGLSPDNWKIKSRIRLKGQQNIDWESMAIGNGRVCIADIGNNKGLRDDLQIFLFSEEVLKAKKCRVIAEHSIRITYPEQDFPMDQKGKHDRDAEAITWVGNRLMLFTKNWKTRMTYLVDIDPAATEVVVQPVDTLDVGILITGADYNAEEDLMVLSGYVNYKCYLVLIPHFSDAEKRPANLRKYYLQGLDNAQTEGVAFYGENGLYLSTEKAKNFTQRGYYLNYQRLVLPTGMRPEVCLKDAEQSTAKD